MNWWGKILGGTFGMMIGGPIGVLLGVVLGHNFDKAVNISSSPRGFGRQEKIQTLFYTTTFSVMGHVCKADGRVSEDEIALAQHVMQQMDLSTEQKKTAINLFDEGKRDTFPFNEVIQQFRQEVGYRPNLLRMFMEVQIMAVYADGLVHPAERELLLRLCKLLNVSQHELDHLCAMIANAHNNGRTQASQQTDTLSLKQAYAVLNLDKNANEREIKRAYRRLMSRHHPDKLVAKGLPEEMMKVAADRTHEIRLAYEVIKKVKGF